MQQIRLTSPGFYCFFAQKAIFYFLSNQVGTRLLMNRDQSVLFNINRKGRMKMMNKKITSLIELQPCMFKIRKIKNVL